MTESVARILWLTGYVLLIGPPRTFAIRARARQAGSELSDLPFAVLIGIEVMVRGGLLLLFMVAVEGLLGKALYEYLLLDYFFIPLVFTGCVHLLIYLYCFSSLGNKPPPIRTYRLVRNACYAVAPALAASFIGLLWQHYNQQPLLGGNLIPTLFALCWTAGFIAGCIEALIIRRKPKGLDAVLSARISPEQ
ncbi:hypothetical protein EXU34_08630 [Alteromonas sp. ZYF713]|nr:hypothetical protein [Alteromonas sp. ZYF713]